MSKRRVIGLGVLVVLGVLVAGCSGAGEPEGYRADVRHGFVDDCTTSGTSRATCECFYETMASRVPYTRFQAVNEKMQAGSTRIPGDIAGMAAGCAARVRSR